MENEIAVAVMALVGSGFGTLGGIVTSNKLINHRIKALEKKVEKHNNVISRTYVLEEKMKVANHRIDGLETRP